MHSYLSLNHYCGSADYIFLNNGVTNIVAIGRDSRDDLVFGKAQDGSAEVYCGERLIFRLMPQLESEDELSAAAAASLEKDRLGTARGFINCPPNCGAELFDVVCIFDEGIPFEGGMYYRVTAINNVFNALNGSFSQRLELCSL